MILQRLEQELKTHDWTYKYADGDRWRRGHATTLFIAQLMKQAKEEGLYDQARELYDKYDNLEPQTFRTL